MKVIDKKFIVLTSKIWICCVILLAVFHYFLVLPQRQELHDVQAQVAEKEQEQTVLQDAQREPRRTELVEALEEQQRTLDGYLADYGDSSELTFAIRELSDGYDIQSFTSKHQADEAREELKKCQYVTEQRINVNLETSFGGFLGLVNALERNRPVMFLDAFVAERDKQEPYMKVNMELAVFVQSRQDRELTARAY